MCVLVPLPMPAWNLFKFFISLQKYIHSASLPSSSFVYVRYLLTEKSSMCCIRLRVYIYIVTTSQTWAELYDRDRTDYYYYYYISVVGSTVVAIHHVCVCVSYEYCCFVITVYIVVIVVVSVVVVVIVDGNDGGALLLMFCGAVKDIGKHIKCRHISYTVA